MRALILLIMIMPTVAFAQAKPGAMLISWQHIATCTATACSYNETVNGETKTITVTGFKLYRKGPAAEEKVFDILPNIREVEDATVKPGNPYTYSATAYNTAGESPKSNEATATAKPGISVTLPANYTILPPTRRLDSGSTVIATRINKSTTISVNGADPLTGAPINDAEIKILTRPGITVLVTRRLDDGSTIVPFLINSDEPFSINEKLY